jgi:hypothetical protein
MVQCMQCSSSQNRLHAETQPQPGASQPPFSPLSPKPPAPIRSLPLQTNYWPPSPTHNCCCNWSPLSPKTLTYQIRPLQPGRSDLARRLRPLSSLLIHKKSLTTEPCAYRVFVHKKLTIHLQARACLIASTSWPAHKKTHIDIAISTGRLDTQYCTSPTEKISQSPQFQLVLPACLIESIYLRDRET